MLNSLDDVLEKKDVQIEWVKTDIERQKQNSSL